MNPRIREVLLLIQRTFIVNRKVKRGRVGWGLAAELYDNKTLFINKAICLIREHQLPIKYGYKNDDGRVIYFEYLGHQVSFHDPRNQVDCHKLYKGAWVGVRQNKSPFSCILAKPKRHGAIKQFRIA
jgi:hypothetical protein